MSVSYAALIAYSFLKDSKRERKYSGTCMTAHPEINENMF